MRNQRLQRRRLRAKLLKTHKKCTISGWNNPLELQMAHIIPKKIGYHINYKHTDTEYNCVILSNSLHSLFDSFQWTIDIFSFLEHNVESDATFRTSLLIKNPPRLGQSSLSGCINRTFTIPIKYYPSFYAHYYVYLRMNYTTDVNPKQCFRDCVQSPLFKHLQTLTGTTAIKSYLLQLRARPEGHDHHCTILTGHRADKYRVLWHLWAWEFSTWEPLEHLTGILYSQYIDYREQQDDPDWKPAWY